MSFNFRHAFVPHCPNSCIVAILFVRHWFSCIFSRPVCTETLIQYGLTSKPSAIAGKSCTVRDSTEQSGRTPG